MRFAFTAIAAIVAGSSSVLAALESRLEFTEVPGAGTDKIEWLADLTFEGPVVQGGPNVTISGKYDDIMTKVLALNPEYKPEDFETAESKTRRARDAVDRLRPRNKNGIVCNVAGGCKANWFDTLEAVSVDQPSIRVHIPAGWGYCINLLRYRTVGLFVCNDNSYAIDPALPYLVTYFRDIYYSGCGTNSGVNGQEFDSDRYNALLPVRIPASEQTMDVKQCRF